MFTSDRGGSPQLYRIAAWGGQAKRYPITPDDSDAIRQQVAEAAREHDMILLNAGSSAGSEDFSAGVVESLGDLLVHGVAVRPGHPVILGMVDTGAAFGTQQSAISKKQELQKI